MIKEAKLLVTLALVATFVCCQAAPLDEAEDNEAKDTYPVIEAEFDGHLLKAPVYEDKVFTDQRRKLDIDEFRIVRTKLLEVADAVIVKRNSYLRVAKKAYGFIGLFNDFLKAGRELSKTDTSPPLDSKFGPEMSQLVQVVLKTQTDTIKSDQETYKIVETVMCGIEELIKKSPVGLYLDWNQLIIDGEPMPVFIAPVIQWLKHNGYGMILKVVGLVGGLFKNIGNRKPAVQLVA